MRRFFFKHDFFLSGIAVFFLTLSLPAKAESARYESALLVPWSTLTDAVVKTVGGENDQLMNLVVPHLQVMAQEIPVDLENVQIQVNGALRSQSGEGVDVHWSGGPLGVRIDVGSFEVSQVIERWVDGVKVRVHLDAICRPFNITQKGAALDVALSWLSQDTSLNARVSHLQLSWPSESWLVSEISCQGPQGFADVIQSELRKQLSDPSQWEPLIRENIESELNQKIEQTLQSFRQPRTVYSDEQTQIELQFSGVDALNEKGLVLKGFIQPKKAFDETPAPIDPESIVPLDVAKAMEGITTDTPLLLIPGKELATVTRKLASERQVNYDLSRINSFRSFLGFRLFQFFIWPDLLNFSTSAKFPVISRMGKDPQVTYDSFKLYVKGSANSWVYVQRRGQVYRYIDSATQFSAWVTPTISEGKLQLGFGSRRISTSAQMAPDYVRAFNPSRFLPTWLLSEALENLPFFKSLSVDLPEIELDGGLKYKAYRMHYLVKDLFIIEMR